VGVLTGALGDAGGICLKRKDARVFQRGQLADVVTALAREPESLVVESNDPPGCFLGALPGSLEFGPCSRRPNGTVGWVRRQ
jgi:hypothetical protein